MRAEHAELWRRIESFSFDDGAPILTFEQRLARENGWPIAYTRRVLNEYKRFVFLTMTAGHPMCPSEQVDQAWHLHLTYTKSYWEQFCRGVLGRPLHHDPTRGGHDEHKKHTAMYEETLAAIASFFAKSRRPISGRTPRPVSVGTSTIETSTRASIGSSRRSGLREPPLC